jgi:hypothetical protein
MWEEVARLAERSSTLDRALAAIRRSAEEQVRILAPIARGNLGRLRRGRRSRLHR